MATQKYPIFSKGSILTHEMLDILKEYSIDNETLRYLGYCDGIVNGCHISTSDTNITVDKGVIIINSQPYYIKEPITIHVKPSKDVQILVFRCTEQEKSFDYVFRDVSLAIVKEEDIIVHDIEVCRFILQEGAALRSLYSGYDDMSTTYDTICMTHAKWSSYEKSTISPYILNKYFDEAIKHNGLNELDKQFLSRIAAMTGESLTAKEICTYIAMRLEQPYKEMVQHEMFSELSKILRIIKDRRERIVDRRMSDRRLIVD